MKEVEGVCRCFDSRTDDQWGLSAGSAESSPNGVKSIKFLTFLGIAELDMTYHTCW